MNDDLSDCDGEFEGLKLKSVEESPRLKRSETPHVVERVTSPEESTELENVSESPVRYESTFTCSFLPKSVTGFSMNEVDNVHRDEDSYLEHSEEPEIQWNTKSLYKTISSVETNRENEMCILRLLDTISSLDIAGQQMTENLTNFGRFIESKNDEELKKLGYKNVANHHVLEESVKSFKSTVRLLSLEISELESIVEESIYSAGSSNRLRKNRASGKSNWGFNKVLSIALTTGCLLIVANELRKIHLA